MKCVRCGTDNIDLASYCIECEAPLKFRRRSERYHARKILITGAIVIVWVSLFMFFFRDSIFTDMSGGPQTSASYMNARTAATEAARAKLNEELQKAYKLQQEADNKKTETPTTEENVQALNKSEAGREIVSGVLTILDPWGKEMAVLQAVVLNSGLVAIPARACVGGTKWTFDIGNGSKAEIQSGLWQRGESVGLWQVVPPLANDNTVELRVWNSDAPVRWLSIQSEMEMDDVPLSSFRIEGDYVIADFPGNAGEVGVLVQDDGVVGWTFGQWLSGAYLWSPEQEGSDKAGKPSLTVSTFYELTFANGREERFNMALGLGENGNLADKLALIVEGFMLAPKLAIEDTPYYLLPDAMIKYLRPLVKRALVDDMAKMVIDKFDRDVLLQIGDINLFMDICRSITSVYGYEPAIVAIEQTGTALVQRLGFDVPALNDLHLGLYQEWLQNLVSKGNIEEAERVYSQASRYYANDAYIHLLNVELLLLKGEWAEAERLLYQRNYPPELLDRYELLARQISDLKGQENSIVVRFQPGSNRIPLTATLNNQAQQNFLVDTGASMVTIPYSMVEELGLEIIAGEHYNLRTVSTAGGLRTASEVIIDSIEINGWVEYDLKALVLDIPDQPGLGLLGLNYLSRFRMDLNTEDGILALTPK